MRVLLVSNQVPNNLGVGNPIMQRMKDTLSLDPRIENVEFYPFYNSIKSLLNLRRVAKSYDIVHVHFGGLYALILSCILIGLKSKKYITFHGTDIHAKAIKTTKSKIQKLKIWLNQKASFISLFSYNKCGFVSADLQKYVPATLRKLKAQKIFVQNLGVDYNVFTILDKAYAQRHLRLNAGKYVLFSDVSNTTIKRRDIAKKIISYLGDNYQLLVMSGVKPSEVPYYINACEFAILTSDEEGSPNIIREVLSLNKPFFSVDVGDAAKQLDGLQNSAIISRDPQQAAIQIRECLKIGYQDDTRESKKTTLDFELINQRIVDMYQSDLTCNLNHKHS